MASYTVELSDVEQTAMEFVCVDVNEWIQNVVHERARVAAEEMVTIYVRETLQNGGSVSGTRDEIVQGSNLPSARARHEEQMKSLTTKEPDNAD